MSRRLQLILGLGVVFALLLAGLIPSTAEAQCSVVYSMDISADPSFAQILRVFSGSLPALMCGVGVANGPNVVNCGLVAIMSGAYGCANTMGCLAIEASATAVVSSPSPKACSWSCGPCGLQVIDNSDGLPVELMDFTVEDEDGGGVD